MASIFKISTILEVKLQKVRHSLLAGGDVLGKQFGGAKV